MLGKIISCLFLLTPLFTLAQVCNGAATGKTTMVSGAMSYCDGTTWKSMKGAQGSACTVVENGKMRFQSSKFEFCDGSFWFEMKSGSAISSCTGNLGRMRWNLNRKEFCDGTNWFDMAAVASCSNVDYTTNMCAGRRASNRTTTCYLQTDIDQTVSEPNCASGQAREVYSSYCSDPTFDEPTTVTCL